MVGSVRDPAGGPLSREDDREPLLDALSEEGFVDCLFRIRAGAIEAGARTLVVSARHHDTVVGCVVVLPLGIRGGLDADLRLIDAHVLRGAVEIRRSGLESDRFLEALEARYGGPPHSLRMRERVAFTAIALHEDRGDADPDPLTLKLFGHDGPDEDPTLYSESFLTVDIGAGLVQWNEKDPHYRPALLATLADSH